MFLPSAVAPMDCTWNGSVHKSNLQLEMDDKAVTCACDVIIQSSSK